MGCVITFFTRALVMADMMSREGRAPEGDILSRACSLSPRASSTHKAETKMVLDLTAPVRSAASMLRARTAL